MRVAALYDVHGMPWALEAVLAAVDDENIDKVVFGGDDLSGPYPRETVAMVRALDAIALRGNCEDLAEEWETAELAPGDLQWLQSLPLAAIVDDVLYCHAAPDDNTPITTAITPDDAVLATFGDTSGTVVIGHTHHQFDRTIGQLRVVNAGSVGMAYESDVAAYWTILDDGEPIFRRTRFDVRRAVTEMRKTDWPHGPTFIAENLLVAVDRDEAIASLESRRT
ncbi:MAG: metallophosphoesterase family protein [Gaiellaceae bacterium]